MKTVGQLLKSAREKQAYQLLDIEKATKIRTKYLEALERDEYSKLPSGTYAKGFIKNYAQFLNLPVDTLLAVFRRDFTENERGQIIPRSMVRPLANRLFLWTPQSTLVSVIALVVVIFLGFIFYQYQGFLRPRLEVNVPSEGEILLGPMITVSGSADPSAVVSVNQQLVIVNPDGTFSADLVVPSGKANITVEATNTRGNTSTITRTVEIRKED
jgi:hypothetical protein